MKRIELLAPAGNYEALVAAVESGADAIYMGGSRFNARAFADNFDDEALKKAVAYAHIRGVRIYITVNILISDHELEEVLEYIKYLYSIDIDAIIIQDIALLKLVKPMLPDFEIHCSTQMTVHNSAAARYLADMGADRIVVSRELSLEEIKDIIKNTGVEVEAFVHGALCVCYSGQCYMSSMIGGRSGNRGRCAQPCRRRYSFFDLRESKKIDKHSGKYLLSTRDLNTYKRLEELVASGIASFKIEGRMKKPEYVAAVVKNYRDAIDRLQKGERDYYDKIADDELSAVFNREFTEGYLFKKRNREMVSIDRPDNRGVYLGKVVAVKGRIISLKIEEGSLHDGDGIEIIGRDGSTAGGIVSGIKVKGSDAESVESGKTAEVFIKGNVEVGSLVNKTYDSELYKKINEEYYFRNRKKITINGMINLQAGKNPVVMLWDSDGNYVEYTADTVISEAMKAPLTEDKVREQFIKTGDTPYIFEQLDILIEGNCFMPIKELNGIRRAAIEKLDELRRILNKQRNHESALAINAKDLVQPYKIEGRTPTDASRWELAAGIRDVEGAKAAISAGADTIYYLEGLSGTSEKTASQIKELCDKSSLNFFAVLPIISKDGENLEIQDSLARLVMKYGEMGVVVSNLGQLKLVEGLQIKRIRTNYNLNVFNSVTAAHLKASGVQCIAVSPELNLKQIKLISANTNAILEGFVYGHLPLMTLEYCPESLLDDCSRCNSGRTAIVDEKGKAFPIIKLGNCRTQILNSDSFLLINEIDKLLQSGLSSLRADFYLETPEEIHETVKLLKNMDIESNKDIIEKLKLKGHTKGHYLRGVE